MSNYIGVKCPICGKKFTQADDIVVCPVCGAPHHRECYAKNSACAFVSDHLSGKEWRAPAPEVHPSSVPGDPRDIAICPSCKSPNPGNMIFCQICGNRMSEIPSQTQFIPPNENAWGLPGFGAQLDPIALMYGGLSPDEKIEDETVRDLAVYIGENSAYYLPRFKSMHENSRTISFNFSAFIFNFLYFFHRKMYLIGSLLLAIFVVGAIPSFLQVRELLPQIMYQWRVGPYLPVDQAAVDHYQSLVNVTGTINFLIGFVVSLCANWAYSLKARSDVKKIRESRSEPPDEQGYVNSLSKKGGVSKAAVIIVVSVIIAAYFVSGSILTYSYMGGLNT